MGWHAYCLSLLDRRLLGNARMLVIRRDSDWLEKDLSRRSVFQRCDVLRIRASHSSSKIVSAKGGRGINYLDADPNTLQLPPSMYDAIWSDDTLGHVADLDHLIEQVAVSLQPAGFLFAYEYVGPDRMAIPLAHRHAAQAAFSLIPKRYRKFSASPAKTLDHVELPPLGGFVNRDAPRNSSNVVRMLCKHLQLAQCKPLGGTLLQFVLRDIAANFEGENRDARVVLEMLFAIEDALIDSGELESDFALLIGKKR